MPRSDGHGVFINDYIVVESLQDIIDGMRKTIKILKEKSDENGECIKTLSKRVERLETDPKGRSGLGLLSLTPYVRL